MEAAPNTRSTAKTVPPPDTLLCPVCNCFWSWKPGQLDWNRCPHCMVEHPVADILKALGGSFDEER